MLTDAALEGKIDRLNGLKENVIIGKLIPAATGLKRYRRIEIEPSEPLPARDGRRRPARPGRDRRRARARRRRRPRRLRRRRSTRTSRRSRRSAPAAATPASPRSSPTSTSPSDDEKRVAPDRRALTPRQASRERVDVLAGQPDAAVRRRSVGLAARPRPRSVVRASSIHATDARARVCVDRASFQCARRARGVARSADTGSAGSPSCTGRCSLAFSSQPLHQTSSEISSASR